MYVCTKNVFGVNHLELYLTVYSTEKQMQGQVHVKGNDHTTYYSLL